MTTMWTTSRPRGWPVHGFAARMFAVFLGVGTTIAVWYFQPKYTWTPMERHYLGHYMLASAGWFEKYAVLQTVDRAGKPRLAIPADVEPVNVATAPRGTIPFRLTAAAIKGGEVKLVNPAVPVDRERFKAFLRDGIYHGRTLTDLAKPGLYYGLGSVGRIRGLNGEFQFNVVEEALCFGDGFRARARFWGTERIGEEVFQHSR